MILIISSLPLMILCYLLGGLLLSEITRSYLVLILAAGTFGLVSVACSSYFRRTSSALVVSYLVILPLAVMCVVMTRTDNVTARDFVSIAILPPWCLAAWTVLGIMVNRRLLHPPDVGSEGKDVIDEEEEMKYAIGVVIDRDLFPDKLFAPAKRTDLMPDGTNPVLDKELRSEIFSQGTLMLRVVIQVSMLLSIPLMAVLLFLRSEKAAYYVAYVLTFNLLVGPVFSSGSITQERERQTLSLLLTTLLGPGKIVFAKLLAALRVSTVLTFLLTEQLLLAYVLLPELRNRFWTLAVYLLIIATTCMATSTIGLMCSALARRTATAMVMTYLTLLVLFVLPMGLQGICRCSHRSRPNNWQPSLSRARFPPPLSVPMHTTRTDSWINQPLGVADQIFVPITRNIRMPVYAVFLCIYPVLGFAFYCVAYLAFRWRWWRAGAAWLGRWLCRRPGRSCFPTQGSVFQVPHPVRPAHESDRHGNHVDRTRFALTAHPHLQGELGIDSNLASTLVCLEIGDFKYQGRHRPRMPFTHAGQTIFPVRLETLE